MTKIKVPKTVVVGILTVFLTTIGCAEALKIVMPKGSKTYPISGVEFDEALSYATKAARAIGMVVSSLNSYDGTFVAKRGQGLIEETKMNFSLTKDYQGNLSFTIQVESSKGYNDIINEYVSVYRKHVKIKS